METVLIVEDDELAREVLGEMAQELGYETVLTANGQEALDAMESLVYQGQSLKLVFLDLEMPVMNGVTFRKKQLENPQLADIPVVIVSGHRHPLPDDEVKNVARITKPISLETMRQLLR
jgi:CheY-like chemotaxis protein